MNDLWTNRLSEYLDGELDNTERAALEAHLPTCGPCSATLAELREVVTRAKALEDREPAKNLWPQIADGIRRGVAAGRPAVRPSGRRFSFSIPQLLAASIALVLLSGGTAWLVVGSREQSGEIATRPPRPTSPDVRSVDNEGWMVRSDIAIAELQDALALSEGKLDTTTVRVVRENLAVIDRAISQAQHALKRDPGNTYLNLHLANTMRQKIELLRRANALASES